MIIGGWQDQGHNGSTYVVFGKASGFGAAIDLNSLNGTNGFRFDGGGTPRPAMRWQALGMSTAMVSPM